MIGIALGFFITLSVFTTNSKCSDIVDIYYSKYEAITPYDTDCPYTLTPLDCINCQILYISRNNAEDYMQEWTQYGLTPPFTIRTDTDRVYPPAYTKSFFSNP